MILIKILKKILKLDLISIRFELDRRLSNGKNKKVNRLINDELGGKIMTTFVGLRAKPYGYVVDDGNEDKKQKIQKYVPQKEKLNRKIIKTV